MRAASSSGRGAADRHDEAFRLEARPGKAPALDQLDASRDRRGLLDGDAAEFAIPLCRMAIAEIEKRALGVNGQIQDGARPDIGQIHVAAMVIGLEG
jgi:hypothetical protein